MKARMIPRANLFVAQTTLASRKEAEDFARFAVEERLAACVQLEGPLQSFYEWEGKLESAMEWRLVFKCVGDRLPALAKTVHDRHPYDIPEWIVFRAEEVAEKYLQWAQDGQR